MPYSLPTRNAEGEVLALELERKVKKLEREIAKLKARPKPEAYSTLSDPPVQGADTHDGMVVAYVDELKLWQEKDRKEVVGNPTLYPLWSPTPRIRRA